MIVEFAVAACLSAFGSFDDDALEDALKDGVKVLKKGTAAEKVEAVEDLGKLGLKTADGPSVEVAEFLAEALEDDAIGVRVAAMDAMLRGHHQGTVIEALIGALERTDEDLEWMEEATLEFGEPGATLDPDLMLLASYHEKLVSVVGGFDDDRCVEALVEFIERKPQRLTHPLYLAAAEALLSTNALEGVEAVAASFIKLEKQLRSKKIVGFAEMESDPGRPKSLTLGWVIKASLAPPGKESMLEVHRMLGECAERLNLAETPAREEKLAKTAAGWKKWVKANKEAFESELGELPADAPAVLAREYVEEKKESSGSSRAPGSK